MIWQCLITPHVINVGNVTQADLCAANVGMCSTSECAFGVGSVQVQACNAAGCSAPVPVTSGAPTACGGGCCC